jgi:hypothetical protein
MASIESNAVKSRRYLLYQMANRKDNLKGSIVNKFNQAELPKTKSKISQPDFYGSIDQDAKLLGDHIANSLNEMMELKVNFKHQVQEVITISKNNKQIATAFEKLCNIITSTNDKMISLYESTQENLLSIVALQRDQEIQNHRRNLFIKQNHDRIESVETKRSCQSDLEKVWITFSSLEELKSLEKSKNLINEAKLILTRMNIDMDQLGIMPIKHVHFQRIRIAANFELSLCITFNNQKSASIVRNGIILFNSLLEESNQINELRYNEKIYWSANVWKLLRMCFELRRLKFLDSVRVQAEGIQVKYCRLPENDKNIFYITCFNDIDEIRKIVNDIYVDIPWHQIYSDEYFQLTYEERDRKRNSEANFSDSE